MTAALALIVLAAFAVNYWLAHAAVQSNDRRWCATLELLTRHPVPRPADPQANPSRVTTWRLYEDFVQLGRDFGC